MYLKKIEKSIKFEHFNNEFLLLFLPLDPDPDSESGSGSRDPIESGSNPDPDPKHWVKENKSLDFLKLTTNCLKYVLTHVKVHIGHNLCLL